MLACREGMKCLQSLDDRALNMSAADLFARCGYETVVASRAEVEMEKRLDQDLKGQQLNCFIYWNEVKENKTEM
jgi:hypothetical protein